MALVLKKSLTPKHLTLLQCIRKRNYVSNKSKHIASISSGVACPNALSFLDKSRRRLWAEDWKRAPAVLKDEGNAPLRDCVSNTLAARHVAIAGLTRHLSATTLQTRRASPFLSRTQSCPNLLAPVTARALKERAFSASACPCPPPTCAPCCGSLPPPCNQPPRCVQFMLGYYYYPYGYWFCGPYHVQGQCCPIGPSGVTCAKCPCPTCICPAATTVLPPTGKAPDMKVPAKTVVSSLFKGSNKLSGGTKCGARKSSIGGVRKADPCNPGLPKLFSFNRDATKCISPKPATGNKTSPTLHSSFLCVPYKTSSPMDIAASVSASLGNTKRSPHARIGFHSKNCCHTHSKLSPCRQKRCKYTGYMSPLTLRSRDKDSLDKVEALSRMLGCKQ